MNIETFESVFCNGIEYHVIETTADGGLIVRRPNGIKVYRTRRLPDSPLYGESRARIEPQ